MVFEWTLKPVLLPSLVGFVVLARELSLLITRLSSHRAKVQDHHTLLNIWLTILGSMVLAAPFPFMQGGMSYFHFEWNGIGIGFVFTVLLAGILLRWWAIHVLGKFFTVNVAVQTGHRVINSGPYFVLRHPSYTGLLLEIFAVALAYQNVISIAVIMIPATFILLRRIRHEERVLKRALGTAYREYLLKTYTLVPFLY
ncbi:MAG TPA: isoprenylcysteine carboxylmethyltransferase family protein [Gemmatales bacterium]|nr:isoprenylcysteine carboxylmethyltransferase family protein [Gemmatales bacterium]